MHVWACANCEEEARCVSLMQTGDLGRPPSFSTLFAKVPLMVCYCKCQAHWFMSGQCGFSCLCLPPIHHLSAGIMEYMLLCPALCGFWTQVLTLWGKYFTHWTISPALSWLFLNKRLIYFCAVFVYMYMYGVYVWFPWRAKQGVRALVTGVTDRASMYGAGNQNWSSVLNHWAVSQVPHLGFQNVLWTT